MAAAGSKRKRKDEHRLYAVHIGKNPGIYPTYKDCLDQVKGHPGSIFKSFTTQEEAEAFVRDGPNASSSGKFYGVRIGRVPGVYTDWASASAQVYGSKGSQFKTFMNRKDAEAYVGGALTDANANANVKTTIRSKKAGIPAPEANEIDETVEPGFGPLPRGAEDGFDRRLKLNGDTGAIEYKSEGELKAVKMQATGLAKGVPLSIYTDGSALKNGAKGAQAGVGVYFGPQDSRNVSEPLQGPRQTNQRAELTACRRAIEIAPRDRDIIIFSDSKYSIQCLTEWFINWRKNNWMTTDKKPVENKDLIEPILQKIEERKLMRADTKFEWVKGHASSKGNVAADHLAVNGAREGAFMDVDT